MSKHAFTAEVDGKLYITVHGHMWYIYNSAVHSYAGEYAEDLTDSSGNGCLDFSHIIHGNA